MTTTIKLHAAVNFGKCGDRTHLSKGWSGPEDEFTWAIGPQSELVLPPIEESADCALKVDVSPFVHAGSIPDQRLAVSVNGRVVGSGRFDRRVVLAFSVPATILPAREAIRITFTHPDAARPIDFHESSDERQLAFAFRSVEMYFPVETMCAGGALHDAEHKAAVTSASPIESSAKVRLSPGLSLADLMVKFESLGQSCEFGLVQRRCGAEPLGLFRFSSTFLPNLLRGIECDFSGLGEANAMKAVLSPHEANPEYLIHEQVYGLTYHTFVHADQATADEVTSRESIKLRFLKRKILEDLTSGEKTFVFGRAQGSVSVHEAFALSVALKRRGPNRLLWITVADARNPAGTVRWVADGLLQGYIDRFAPSENAYDFSYDAWLNVCANAYTLMTLGHTGRAGTD